ncbi:uncharacterized protein LOC123318251 [Coccinella septempunctata]|uniref:uncharacterized protein LOC123318251 n=1 Tax=Coccinella septempunctata TaxID=41139 RepID=UPI001D071F5F|nr:uncharacterized protein LOC123318251 [Coccinella septempunctata]
MGNTDDEAEARVPAPSAEDVRAFSQVKGRLDRIWTRVQQMYDSIGKLPSTLNSFMIRSEKIEQIAEEYENYLSQLDAIGARHRNLRKDTSSLSKAFDDLFYKIVEVRAAHKSTFQGVEGKEKTSKSTKSLPNYMPQIQLPRFNGELESFPGFIALYDKVIHTNQDLSDIEKFAFLLSYLDGRALALAQTVVFDPNNYETVYDLLKNEFSNVRVVASHYFNQIFPLQPIKSVNPNSLKVFCDTLQANVNCLNKLEIPDLGQFTLLFWSLRLLDPHTRRDFETKFLNTDFPKFTELIKFLRDRCAVNDLSSDTLKPKIQGHSSVAINNKKVFVTTREESIFTSNDQKDSVCPCCEGPHKFAQCPEFLHSSVEKRKRFIQLHRRCYSCLGRHSIANCNSKNCCRKCGSRKHNTLICFQRSNIEGATVSDNSSRGKTSVDSTPAVQKIDMPSTSKGSKIVNTCSCSAVNTTCLLGTARARVRDINGLWQTCRLVLDSGSQMNLVTSKFALRLGVPKRKCKLQISGVGNNQLSSVRGLISCSLTSVFNEEQLVCFEAAIVDKITSNLPTGNLPPTIKENFSDLRLADPEFYRPASVDILLGVQSYLDVLTDEPQHIIGNPSAISTRLGWVVMGSVPSTVSQIASSLFTISEEESLNNTLKMFWESEDVSIPGVGQSPEDNFCEEYFCSTVSRDLKGRYITRLPFKNRSRPVLGSNRQRSLARFHKLECKFKRDPEYYKLYKENLSDYVEQGHMVPAPRKSDYVMTHHGVLKSSTEKSKLRVVFSPAEKTSLGVSLNETLCTGPKLQSDIGQIVTQFRLFPIAVTCDIKQMYRAIWLHPEDCEYQHIFWRFSFDDPIMEWELRTVTFGISSSPFLAQRTVKQLILDEGAKFPLAAQILESSRFMDDILFGAFSTTEANELCQDLVALLRLGGFELGKWASSCPSVCNDCAMESKDLSVIGTSSIKVLGLIWDPIQDEFRFKVDDNPTTLTKRGILSRVARVYDYNGYLSPVTFAMKVILQRLWLIKADWDELLPSDVLELWTPLEKEFKMLENVSIPRCVVPSTPSKVQIIGFCNASILGMAAVVYLRVETEHGIVCNLLRSKTKVAPLKGWTINRLELGSAVLLTKLIRLLHPLPLTLPNLEIICFSDSTTTLAWIKTPPYKLKTFVSNRVVQISEACPNAVWKHIPGELNAADSASRGLKPSQFLNNQTWWTGPPFLVTPVEN